jgi:hypothetical protein
VIVASDEGVEHGQTLDDGTRGDGATVPTIGLTDGRVERVLAYVVEARR